MHMDGKCCAPLTEQTGSRRDETLVLELVQNTICTTFRQISYLHIREREI